MDEFEFGPLARGIFMALMWGTLPMAVLAGKGMVAPIWFLLYAGGLVFLALGLKPLLVRTGWLGLLRQVQVELEDRYYADFEAERRQEVDRRQRDQKLRRQRYRDPKLPPNW